MVPIQDIHVHVHVRIEYFHFRFHRLLCFWLIINWRRVSIRFMGVWIPGVGFDSMLRFHMIMMHRRKIYMMYMKVETQFRKSHMATYYLHKTEWQDFNLIMWVKMQPFFWYWKWVFKERLRDGDSTEQICHQLSWWIC